MDFHPDVVGLKSFPCVRVKRFLFLSVCLEYGVKRPLQFSLGASHTLTSPSYFHLKYMGSMPHTLPGDGRLQKHQGKQDVMALFLGI